MKITKAYGKRSMTSAPGRKIEYIVIHYTAGVTSREGSALNTVAWFNSAAAVASSDYVVDDTAIVQYNGDIENVYTWHCGGAHYDNKGGKFYGKCTNKNAIGIEVCSTNSTGKMQNANDKTYSFTAATVRNAVALTKHLMKKYSIPVDHVVRHYDCTGKLCPGIIGWNKESGSEAEWQKFKARISETAKLPTQKMYYVQVGAYSVKENAMARLKEAQKYFPEAFIKEV